MVLCICKKSRSPSTGWNLCYWFLVAKAPLCKSPKLNRCIQSSRQSTTISLPVTGTNRALEKPHITRFCSLVCLGPSPVTWPWALTWRFQKTTKWWSLPVSAKFTCSRFAKSLSTALRAASQSRWENFPRDKGPGGCQAQSGALVARPVVGSESAWASRLCKQRQTAKWNLLNCLPQRPVPLPWSRRCHPMVDCASSIQQYLTYNIIQLYIYAFAMQHIQYGT